MLLMLRRVLILNAVGALAVSIFASDGSAYVLIADRPQKRILKYSDAGQFLNVVVTDTVTWAGPVQGSGPTSLALSPDGTKLYVGSLDSHIVRFDFNGTTASNGLVITSNGQSNINDPGGLLFSQSGTTLLASNRDFGQGTSVARLDANGVSQGPDLGGGSGGLTGMTFNPSGQLLVGIFGSNFMGGGVGGGVYRHDGTNFQTLIPNSNNIAGVASILRHGNDLYLTASVGPDFNGRIGKYNINTGAIDGSFGTGGLITPGAFSFPAGLTPAADGSGFLVSLLDFFTTGAGSVAKYKWDGTLVGTWANNSTPNPAQGFVEATAMLAVGVVPEPSALACAALLGVGWVSWRRGLRRS